MSAPVSGPVAEQHRVERLVSGLRIGESTVINGTPVTAISVEVADLLARHEWVSARCRRLSAAAKSGDDFKDLLAVQDELSMCRCQLAAAGLDLIGAAS